MTSRKNLAVAVVLLLLSVAVASSAQESSAPKPSKPPKSVKAGSVPTSMPEGMTKEQADAILDELRQIRLLLEKQRQHASPTPTATATSAENAKIGTAGGYSLGRSDAALTLVEYTDYQCPFCQQFHHTTFQQLKKNYIDTGKLRFVSRDLPLEFHNNALKAAQAARCAGEQDNFWQMRDILIANSTNLGPDAILTYAQQLALDMNQFRLCLDSGKYFAEIQRDIAEAGSAGISGTPTFVLRKASEDAIEGIQIVGNQPYAAFDKIISEYSSKRPQPRIPK